MSRLPFSARLLLVALALFAGSPHVGNAEVDTAGAADARIYLSPTYGYAVGNFALVNGHPDEARAAFEQVTAGEQWAAFGFAAAEAELARNKKALLD